MGQVATPADVTWGATGTTSQIVPMSGRTICGFYIPNGFTGTSIKIKATYKGRGGQITPVTMYDPAAGADFSYGVAADKYVPVNPADFAGVDEIQIVSSASEAAGTTVHVASRDMQ